LVTNEGADSMFRFDEAFPFKNLVDLGNGKRIDV